MNSTVAQKTQNTHCNWRTRSTTGAGAADISRTGPVHSTPSRWCSALSRGWREVLNVRHLCGKHCRIWRTALDDRRRCSECCRACVMHFSAGTAPVYSTSHLQNRLVIELSRGRQQHVLHEREDLIGRCLTLTHSNLSQLDCDMHFCKIGLSWSATPAMLETGWRKSPIMTCCCQAADP